MTEQHPRLRELKFTLQRIFRNPAAIIGFFLVLFFAAVAFFAPQIAPPKYNHNPYLMPHKGFSPTPKPPGETHIFGTTSRWLHDHVYHICVLTDPYSGSPAQIPSRSDA